MERMITCLTSSVRDVWTGSHVSHAADHGYREPSCSQRRRHGHRDALAALVRQYNPFCASALLLWIARGVNSGHSMGALSRLLIPVVVVGAISAVGAHQPPAARPTPVKPAPAAPRAAQPAPEAASPQRRRPPDSVAVGRGQRTFGLQCGFCHGADARGGAQGGVDLLQSAIVLEDEGGNGLAKFLKVGRPEKNMPRFDLPRPHVSDIAAFLHSRVETASSGSSKVSILVGDAKAGAAYFNGTGRCTTCHSVAGDLKGIGARYEPVMLQGRMVVPRGRGGYPGPDGQAQDRPLRATVTRPSGERISGDVIYLSDFYVSLKDASGRRHTFIRRGEVPTVEITDPLHAHVALLRALTDKDMHDLTAYLSTIK
jgi:mono/diheme cytochrome c family protein